MQLVTHSSTSLNDSVDWITRTDSQALKVNCLNSSMEVPTYLLYLLFLLCWYDWLLELVANYSSKLWSTSCEMEIKVKHASKNNSPLFYVFQITINVEIVCRHFYTTLDSTMTSQTNRISQCWSHLSESGASDSFTGQNRIDMKGYKSEPACVSIHVQTLVLEHLNCTTLMIWIFRIAVGPL